MAGVGRKLTRQQILDEWHADLPVPSTKTLWRWLDRAVELGLVHCSGSGRRNDPFLYWLPQQEMLWGQDPLHAWEEERRQVLRRLGMDPEE